MHPQNIPTQPIPTFQGHFTQQEPIPEPAIEQAVQIMRSGRLHRYNSIDGEPSETALLEKEFAAYLGSKYALACASGGYALHIALCAYGLLPGEPVLTNGWTLSPVPGAIINAGGKPVLVETTEKLVIDLEDLAAKIESTGSRLLLLSHMRGHLVDMDRLCDLLAANNVTLIEDCAHTMGATWRGKKSGRFGVAACFSTQTYKHINSGEGGFIVSDNPDLAAKATMLSGSYMLYDRHLAGPAPTKFEEIKLHTPNFSGRMDNLRAAILRPQLTELDEQVARWGRRYEILEGHLRDTPGIRIPIRPAEESFVGSSIQFMAEGLDSDRCLAYCELCQEHGVSLKWFGAPNPQGYTSSFEHWLFVNQMPLPKTAAILSCLFDMRIPLTFSLDDCHLIGTILSKSFLSVSQFCSRQ